MLKHIIALSILVVFGVASEWVSLDSSPDSTPPTITILQNDARAVVLNVTIHGFFKEDTIIGDITYQRLVFPQAQSCDVIGDPMTPAIKKLIQILPTTGTNLSYEMKSDTILDNYYIMPYQRLSHRADSLPPFEKNPFIYGADIWFPYSVVCKTDPAILADLRIIALSIFPVKFNPWKEKISVIKDLDVTISFTGIDTINTTTMMPTIRSDRLDLFYRDQILNYIPQVDTPIVLGGPYWKDINYSILIPDEYYDNIEDFVFWRNKCGYTMNVFKLSQIPGYNGLPEDTSQIRSFIADNCYTLGQNNTVLLIGDENNIPFFWEWVQPIYGTPYPSDHYYSLIRGTDEFSDIDLGRLYVKSADDIATFIDKIFWYERYRTPEPEWYPGDCWLFHGQNSIMENAKTWVWHIIGGYYCITRLRNNPSFVYNRINGYGKGAINYFGHGLHDRWLETTSNVFWTTSDIQNYLTNEHEYPLVVNMCCHNGAIQQSTPCMVEAWTLTPQKGAVAAIGATEKCWGMAPPPNNILCRMDTTIWRGFAASQDFKYRRPFGLGLRLGKNLMVQFANIYALTNARVYWLDGDPELTRWFDNYSILIGEHPQHLYTGQNEITVTIRKQADNSPVRHALVCFYKPGDVQEVVITDYQGQATTTLNIGSTGTLYVTARAPTHWPYESTIDVILKDIDNPQVFGENNIIPEFGINEVRLYKEYIEIFFQVDRNNSNVQLAIYDLTGRFITSCFDEIINAGNYHVKWRKTDKIGTRVSAGTYFCKLQDQNREKISMKKFIIP
jgi:hypothetical protein